MGGGGAVGGSGGGVELFGRPGGLFKRPTGIVNLLVVGFEVAIVPPERNISSS